MSYGKGRILQPLPSFESVSSPTILYAKLSPAHCMGENWKRPGPQTWGDLYNGERANFKRLVLGCIEAKVCK